MADINPAELTPDQIQRGISIRPTPQPAPSAWDNFPVAPEVASAPQGNQWSAFPEVQSPSIAEDVAKSAGIGVVKGSIKIPGMIGDARELANSAFDKLFSYAGQKLGVSTEQIDAMRRETQDALEKGRAAATGTKFPTSQELQDSVESVTGPFYKPQTRPGEYAETVGEFAPGAVMLGGNPISNVVKFAAIPGIASEAADSYAKGTKLEPYARPAAAIAAGAGASALMRPSTAERIIRGYLPDYINKDHIDRAEKLVSYAAQRGVNLTWPEALSRVTGQPVLTDMQRIIESSPTSRTGLQTFMGARPRQIDVAARDAFDRIAPRSPQPSQLGPELSAGAGETLDATRRGINGAAKPFYDKAANTTLTQNEMRKVLAIPGFAAAREAVRNDPQLNRYVSHLPDNSVGFLNEVKKYFNQQGKNAAAPFQQNASAQRASGFDMDADAVKRIAANASTDYSTALAVESVGREKFLTPLLNGPLGRIADEPKTRAVIDALFPANPLAGSEGEITKAVGALSRTRPAAAQMLVRTYLESAFDNITRNLQAGPNQFGGASFAAAVAGNPQQRMNLKAALDSLPGGAGKYEGFEKFLTVLEATGTRMRVGSQTAFNGPELAMLKTGTPVVEIAKKGLSPSRWWSFADEKIGHWQIGRNLDELSAIIVDPNSAALLKRIAKLPTGSREAQVIALRLALQNSPTQPKAKATESSGQ